jgi:hypothetical protein
MSSGTHLHASWFLFCCWLSLPGRVQRNRFARYVLSLNTVWLGWRVGSRSRTCDGQLHVFIPNFLKISDSSLNSSTQDQCYLRSADFNTSIPLPCFDDGSFDQSFTLGPGTYFLSLADQLITDSFFEGNNVITDHLVLTADFTPIPEPGWGVFLLASLLVVVSGYASLRRHGRA